MPKIYLTTAPHPRKPGKILGVVSLGSPQMGDQVVRVLDLKMFDTKEEAVAWYEESLKTRPWEKEKTEELIPITFNMSEVKTKKDIH